MNKIVVLAYSGGARSTAGIQWLKQHHRADVVTVTLDLGQPVDLNEIREHALASGAIRAHVIDARDEFVREAVLPSLKAGALADGRYPMSTAITRPIIAKQLVQIARIEKAKMIAHGCASRDAARINRALKAIGPEFQAITFAEEPGFTSPVDEASERVDANMWAAPSAAVETTVRRRRRIHPSS